jgi:hypothetical protein
MVFKTIVLINRSLDVYQRHDPIAQHHRTIINAPPHVYGLSIKNGGNCL